ncbi:MAG: shikimate dehydrogenase [Bacillales bacterium]|nr:shikimate dehydrogenase [Bacillales bacterium]
MMKLYGVIGDPIAHSMSPAMHNDAFKRLGIPAYYHPFHVKPNDLEKAVEGMKAIGVEGFNVTIPHKTAIIPFLDELDPLAEAIGAVNTVVRKNYRWIGYNTDGDGFVRGLKEALGRDLHHDHILIIGAGGAARAIYYTLASLHVRSIDIANRTMEKAARLAEQCPFETETSVFSITEAEKRMENYSIVIQTTSIGMSPKTDEMPISLSLLKKGAFVSDIIYNPLETKFLAEAKKQGAKTQNGIKMFVYQGVSAFEKWTGVVPDANRMEKIVLKQLGGYHVNR